MRGKTITIQDAMDNLKTELIRGCSRSTIHKLIRDNEIKAIGKAGRNRMIDADSLDAYILKAKRLPTIDDWYIAFYIRTSKHKDPRAEVRIKALGKLVKWAIKVAAEKGIHLCFSPNQRACNVMVYQDCGGINSGENNLPDYQRMCKDMSRGKPKMRYLFVYTMDRIVKGDSTYFRNLCKAFQVEFFCRDIMGKREEEILKDDEGRILLAKAQREVRDNAERGINRSKKQKDQRFASLLARAHTQLRVADEHTQGKIEGLLLTYDNNDRGEGLYRAFQEVLGKGR